MKTRLIQTGSLNAGAPDKKHRSYARKVTPEGQHVEFIDALQIEKQRARIAELRLDSLGMRH